MQPHHLADQLEVAARDALGNHVSGWTATLRPLNHAEASNDIWMGRLDEVDVFVKRHARIEHYLNESYALRMAREGGMRVPAIQLASDTLRVLVLGRLEGDLLATRWPRMSRPERNRIAMQAGELAARLHHACPGTAFGARAAPGLAEGASWPEYARASLARWLEAVANLDLPFDWRRVDATLSAYLARETFTAGPSLAHYDISPRNLIISGEDAGGATAPGLLDWELARYDHPGMDVHQSMGAKWLSYDPALVRAFRTGVAAVAPIADVAELDHHHAFFTGFTSLSTLAYLARVGVKPDGQRFYRQQVDHLGQSLRQMGMGPDRRNTTA